MKILIIEYITAGGLCHQPLPDSLMREGTLMRDALLADFSELADVELFTTVDTRVSFPKQAGVVMPVDNQSNVIGLWETLLQQCDAALIIAPETDGILCQLTQMVDACGVINLGVNLAAVELFSNKYATYVALSQAKISTVPTYTASEFLQLEFFKLNDLSTTSSSTSAPLSTPLFNHGCVAKPIDGAGCGDTRFFTTVAALHIWLNEAAQYSQLARYIVQPFQAGSPASISMLCKNGSAWLLSGNQQLIEMSAELNQTTNQTLNQTTIQQLPVPHATIIYKGSLVNGLSSRHDDFSQLAQTLAHAFPDLNGYVGVDVIINGDDIFVVEVNPRITTSYIALHKSLNINPAKLILELAKAPVSMFKLPENMATNEVLIHINE